jgi:lipoprotein-releasing system permease protein
VYKMLLCWRYLRTRYLAMVCVVSVMLGVATLIVVNSVMTGFSTKLKDRLHGLLSDVVIESTSLEGFPDPDEKIRRIMASPAGKYVAAVAPTVEVFAMIQFKVATRGGIDTMTRPVRLFGVDPESRAAIGGFAEYLADPRRRDQPSFELSAEARKRNAWLHPPAPQVAVQPLKPHDNDEPPPPEPPPVVEKEPVGIVVGNAIASFRERRKSSADKPRDTYLLEPGDDVLITTVSGGPKLSPVFDRFTVCDYFKSEMSEYDANYVFVPLDYLQRLRAMDDRVTALNIKLTDYKHAPEVKEALDAIFPAAVYQVSTWEEKQGALLAAISIERGILNVILFMIVVVAGFGIMSIFSMIVTEKTRDIGILRSLGASSSGVMAIFLGYGLLLGVVGAGVGTSLGLLITDRINEIERVISRLTGHDVFDRTVYYFDKIPTDVQMSSVMVIDLGAVLVAVVFSILPALRAAGLHPVRALRYE